ncbi:hypothetical protein L2E82_02349 [Cichorium intybus]|uniref:Uncharacterized protein n=1 Tax=Cichorium intybus TaxID=13427 RepID=A0ACB9H2I4_CICIN|nr:hypothetical protein L2E82_02349 [Cichorium intybus]
MRDLTSVIAFASAADCNPISHRLNCKFNNPTSHRISLKPYVSYSVFFDLFCSLTERSIVCKGGEMVTGPLDCYRSMKCSVKKLISQRRMKRYTRISVFRSLCWRHVLPERITGDESHREKWYQRISVFHDCASDMGYPSAPTTSRRATTWGSQHPGVVRHKEFVSVPNSD